MNSKIADPMRPPAPGDWPGTRLLKGLLPGLEPEVDFDDLERAVQVIDQACYALYPEPGAYLTLESDLMVPLGWAHRYRRRMVGLGKIDVWEAR